MNFGNWNVTDNGIEYSGGTLQRFVISKNEATEILDLPDSAGPVYKWILLATEEDWLTEDDLYDLNYAFVFAASKFGVPFDYDIFENTLDYQFQALDFEGDEFPDLDEDQKAEADAEQQRKDALTGRD